MRLAACGGLLTLLAASPGACLAAGVPGGAERGGPAGNAQRGGIRHHLQVSGWARGWVGDWRGQAGSLPPTMMQLLGPAIAPNLLCFVACPGCSERRGQSQKPEEIYQLIEKLVPNGGWMGGWACLFAAIRGLGSALQRAVLPARAGTVAEGRGKLHAASVPSLCVLYTVGPPSRCITAGKYLEIFGRKNNLRDFWVTVGNEVTGQGAPKTDQAAIEEGLRIPNAVYGRAG